MSREEYKALAIHHMSAAENEKKHTVTRTFHANMATMYLAFSQATEWTIKV